MPASIRPTSRCVSILAALRSAFLVLTWAPALRCFAGTTNGFRGTSISFRFSFRFTFISFQSIVYGAVGTVTIRPLRIFSAALIHLSYNGKNGGGGRIRTDSILLAKQALYQLELHPRKLSSAVFFVAEETTGSYGADSEIRTRDIELGRIALYQLSYVRKKNLVVHLRRIELRFTG